MAEDLITLDFDGSVAILSNNRPDKHNAANDAMDAQLWQRLAELHQRDDVRAIVWRGNGKSFSSGRDTTQLGVRSEDISNLDFIERGHAGTQQFFTIPAPIVVALKGWVIGGSFERALLCDLRIAGESAKMMLPEVKHGVVPDSGGTARLFQMAGHGLAADLALTGRVMDAQEALRHGVVSRVVPDAQLDETCLTVAREIAAQPADMFAAAGTAPERVRPDRYGITVETLTADLAKRHGYAADAKGVLVTKVQAGSDADDEGVAAGMVIDRVDGQAVATAEQFTKALDAAKAKKVRLRLMAPGGMRRYVVITPK